jgi:hypothetical protein
MTIERPNWGWGEHPPVPVFHEAEIRSACAVCRLSAKATDALVGHLKQAHERQLAARPPQLSGGAARAGLGGR